MSVPLPTNIDPSGQAQTFDGLAGRALLFGDTKLAREYHEKAARIYERQVLNLRKRSDKDALRYQAAMQYYLGGFYDKALKLCRKIQADMLPNRFRGNYAEFLKAVRERAEPEYVQKIREEIERHWQKHEFQRVLDLLKEHQYVIENESWLAARRGKCCEGLGDYKTAAIFLSDAVQKAPNDPQGMSFVAAAPIDLLCRGQLTDAWEYAQQLLTRIPHPLTTLAAAVVRFHQAVSTQDNREKQKLHEEHLRLFHQAEESFIQLPTEIQQRPDYRELMILGFGFAVGANCYLGDLPQAVGILNRAITFAPNDAFLRSLESALTAPNPDAKGTYLTVIESGNSIIEKRCRSNSPFDLCAA